MTLSKTLRHKIQLLRRESGEDAAGQPVDEWVAHAQRWASILTVNGKAAIQADQVSAKVKASFRVRWCTDLLPGMRVVHGGATYSVLQALPDLQHREHVDLVCEAV